MVKLFLCLQIESTTDSEEEVGTQDEFLSFDTDSNNTNKNASTSAERNIFSSCFPLKKMRQKATPAQQKPLKVDLPVAYITSFVLEMDSHPVDQESNQ